MNYLAQLMAYWSAQSETKARIESRYGEPGQDKRTKAGLRRNQERLSSFCVELAFKESQDWNNQYCNGWPLV